jgi:DNA invertase Pin-like site-specific DNA recombinase
MAMEAAQQQRAQRAEHRHDEQDHAKQSGDAGGDIRLACWLA